jgi:uncharacterized protein (DUF58 family)
VRRAWPSLPEPFPPEFRAMLDRILRHGMRVRGARRELARSRHRALVQSGTFAGHRPYVAGDDLRRIDWHACARTGQLFVKLLTEDERRATTLLVDTSASMLAGNVPRLCTALRLAAILGGLALVHLDGVLVQTASGTAFTGRSNVPVLLDHLRALAPAPVDLDDVARQLARQRAPGKVHWISDFADPAATERTLHRLRRLGFQVTGWLPAIADDLGVPAGGWTRIVDPETGGELRLRVDRELAAAMAHELQLLQRQQQRVFAVAGQALQRVAVPADSFDAGRWLEAGWSFRR